MQPRLGTRIWTALILGLSIVHGPGHTGTPVIVDADWAGDDARAVALILSDPAWDVIAVVATEGAASAGAGATNASRLLRLFGETDVPVGVGRPMDRPPPAFRQNAEGLAWERLGPPMVPPQGFSPAREVLRQALQQARAPVIYVCTGPLTTLAELLEHEPSLAHRIEAVVWYGSAPETRQPDWNARFDPEAVRTLVGSGLRVEVVGYPAGRSAPVLERAWVEQAGREDTPAARVIRELFGQGHGAELTRQRHLRFWDDLVALRLLEPDRFGTRPVQGRPRWQRVEPRSVDSLADDLAGLIREGPLRQTVVLNRFPADLSHLRADVRRWAPEIQRRHGLEEWRLVVLTSELHRHLGTWSIVGAKMGLRARELLGAGMDELQVESRAGLRPPVSCVNDGLQVATGASLGRGTITVSAADPPECAALFLHEQRQLRLRLRNELAEQIRRDLARLSGEHGGLTPAYFAAVRQLALRHWLEIDRRTAFEEQWISSSPVQSNTQTPAVSMPPR